MQVCAPSWEASADRMWNHHGAKYLCQYQTGGGANWPTAFPCQDGRGYQNVSHGPQTCCSAAAQDANYGHGLVDSRVFNHNIGQKASVWIAGASSCAQRDIAAYQNPSAPSWGSSGVVHDHGGVPEHHVHRSRFYQKPLPKYPQSSHTTSGRSFSGANTNQTAWQQPESRSILQNFHNRTISQEETRLQISRITETIQMQARMAERTPDYVPGKMLEKTLTRMPETTSTRMPTQYSPYSSLHTVQAPQPPQTVCAASPAVARVAGESSQLSKPDNRSHSRHQTPPPLNPPLPQNPEELELLTTALQAVVNMPPLSGGNPPLADQIQAAACSPRGQKDPSAGDTNGQTASPVRKRRHRRAPQPSRPEEPESPEENQSERPVGVLQSLSTRNWTAEDLAVLVRDINRAHMKSPETSVLFNSKDLLISKFWKNGKALIEEFRMDWFSQVTEETFAFCIEHVTPDATVLSEAKFDLKLSGLQVLQDGDVYSEPPYSSVWRNTNQQLDDIDKEFGLGGNLAQRIPPPRSPSAPVTAEAPSPEAKPTSLEQVRREEKPQQGPEMDSAAVVSPSEDLEDVYSFIIEVLPQEMAKAIYESINNAEEASAKSDLKSSAETKTSLDKGDSEREEEEDRSNTKLESFFEHWKDVLNGYQKQEMVQNDQEEEFRWEDLDFSFLCMDVDDNSVDCNRSQDAFPLLERKDDQEIRNHAAQDSQASEKVSRQDDREIAHVSQQDCRELVKVSRQNDQEMADVCPQEDARELASVSQKDEQKLVEVTQLDEQAISNVTQQETQKVSNQQHGQETGKPTQKDDDQGTANAIPEMTKVCQPVLVLPSKVSCPAEKWTFQGHRSRVEVVATKLYPGERTLCLAERRLAAAKRKRKRTKQSRMSIPCLKKLKSKPPRKDGSKRSKEAPPANGKLPVELVLYGSAGRNCKYALAHHAPEVLNVSPKGRSPIKQRLYEEWCRPPTRIDGKCKSLRKSLADMARKEPPLPTLTFKKDNGRISLTLNQRVARMDAAKKEATDVRQRTEWRCDKVHRATERPPWDHHLRSVAMGTFAGTTAATMATGSS